MNQFTDCMQPNEIDSFLDGDLTYEQSTSMEQHLAECSTCRASLESSIGPPQWWTEVRTSLASAEELSLSQANVTSKEPGESPTHLLKLLGPTDDPAMLGRIDAYEISGILGCGGMGAVFKGFDRSLNRYVAIKMLLPHLAASGAARKRFAREAQAVAAVVDDHVMPVHYVGEWQGIPYLVMTYSKGVSLQKRVNEKGALELKETLRIGLQAVKGLAAAHAQGLVHRDIKPANIFLSENVERVQLMDFGLARAADDASLTMSGILAGTPQYMSPEQARAEQVDWRSDLFSLGSVLYTVCVGRPPFRAASSHSVLRLITDTAPRQIREVNPDIPAWLCHIINRLMEKSPDDRYQSAEEVAELLESCLAHVQDPLTSTLPKELQTTPDHGHYRTRAIFVALASLVILFGGVLWSTSGPPDISGKWYSDEWGTVELKQGEKPNRYAGTITPTESKGPAGEVNLKWSRIERRYNGAWKLTGQDQGKGTLSIHLVDDLIRGAFSSNKRAQKEVGMPEMAELEWNRIDAVVSSKNVTSEKPTESAHDDSWIILVLQEEDDEDPIAPAGDYLNNHVRLLKSSKLIQQALNQIQSDKSVEAVQSKLRVESVRDSQSLIRVSSIDKQVASPAFVEALVNAYMIFVNESQTSVSEEILALLRADLNELDARKTDDPKHAEVVASIEGRIAEIEAELEKPSLRVTVVKAGHPNMVNAANVATDRVEAPRGVTERSVDYQRGMKMTDTDDEFRQQLTRIQQLRVERKPTIDEVNEIAAELMVKYPDRSGAIHWQAAHVFGQSGIKEFADEVRRHATGALMAEDDPVRRTWMYMYLSNLEEVQGQPSKANYWALRGLLELQPFDLPEVAPEPGPIGRFRDLLNPGDEENYESQYELFQRLAGTEQEMHDAAVRTRELVRFRGIYISILKRLNKSAEDKERLQDLAREVGGYEWLDDLVKTLAE